MHDSCYYFKHHIAFDLHVKYFSWYICLNSASALYSVVLSVAPISEHADFTCWIYAHPVLDGVMFHFSVSGNVTALPNLFMFVIS